MGLYLCVFDGDEEVEGVDVGSYSDFLYFRSTVTELLEGGNPGSHFPTLIIHSDSDGEWSPADCVLLVDELREIKSGLKRFPGVAFRSDWQREIAELLGLKPLSLYESFIDVDGEPLIERMVDLCRVAIDRQVPILFQ